MRPSCALRDAPRAARSPQPLPAPLASFAASHGGKDPRAALLAASLSCAAELAVTEPACYIVQASARRLQCRGCVKART